MPDDPFEVRRRGQRRVRAITAWVAGLAAAGTGAVAVAVAAPSSPAAAGTTVQNPGTSGSSDGSGTFSGDGGFSDDGGSGAFQAPAQLPGSSGGFGGFGGSGGGHASSGGS